MTPRSTPAASVTLFYSYSHKDEKMLDKLTVHLAILKRAGVITAWHDRNIGAGEDWKHAIDEHLDTAAIVLLLVSPDFVASDYCWSHEMTRALERHDAGEALVIPIILRPVDWDGAPFGRLQALPKDAKPITVWPNRDLAWVDVVRGIRTAAANVLAGVTPKTKTLPATVSAAAKAPAQVRAEKPPRRPAQPRGKGLHRIIYDAGNTAKFPGTVVRNEGDPPTADVAVNEVYDGLGVCHEFFWTVYGRNSIDGKGKPIEATVHYERDYNNAFWSGKGL